MKVVLRMDYPKIGKMGDIKEISNGYYRNFILPNKIAYPAEPKYLKIFEEEKINKELKEKKSLAEAQKVKDKLEKLSLSISAKVGAEEKIFGTITTADIATALKKEGIDIDKKNILLEEDIKSLGVYTISVKVYKDIVAKLKIWIVKEK